MKIKKAVIPAGGLGTRFHPVSLSIPKEMLPIIDRPILQIAVEELIDYGVEEIIIVISPWKTMIEEYFKESANAGGLFSSHRPKNSHDVRFTYIAQDEAKGLGHAVYLTREAAGADPFFLVLPDDVFNPEDSNLQALAHVYERDRGSVVTLEKVPEEDVHRYGIVKGEPLRNDVLKIDSLVEKPAPEDAPSDLAVIGRYLLAPDIFDALEKTKPGRHGELQLTDALNILAREHRVFGCEHAGRRYDCGTIEGWITANIRMLLASRKHDDDFRRLVRKILSETSED